MDKKYIETKEVEWYSNKNYLVDLSRLKEDEQLAISLADSIPYMDSVQHIDAIALIAHAGMRENKPLIITTE